MSGLVLSIFPGIDLLGRAFEEEGYCIVRGPDLIFGGDVREFHPPAGVFEGVIGGPPCQHWTRLMFLNANAGKGMGWVVSEYARVVEEAAPAWFLMEEVPYAPMPLVQGYHVFDTLLSDDAVGGEQPRQRRFSFGTPDAKMLHVVLHERTGNGRAQSVLADGRRVPVKIGGSGKRKTTLAGHSPIGREHLGPGDYKSNIEDACEAQGLPPDFADGLPFTKQGKHRVIGNGVPMAMGRAVAQAVRRAGGAAVRAR